MSTRPRVVEVQKPSIGPAQRELVRELIDLKRVRSAGRAGTTASRLFAAGWAMLAEGEPAEEVMLRIVAAAVAAARLGDLDYAKLRELGLDHGEAVLILRRGFEQLAGATGPGLRAQLRTMLAIPPTAGDLPAFVALLEQQPRAGVTCPGKPRLMLEPAENHAEHCFAVAVAGALLAPFYDADPTEVFLGGMAHHLHGAHMPDSGFTGEMLLGDALAGMMERARERSLAELPASLVDEARSALRRIEGADTPEGRAFHAADVIDRVLEIEGHLRAAGTDMEVVLSEYELVHASPVKPFHDRVLAEAELL